MYKTGLRWWAVVLYAGFFRGFARRVQHTGFSESAFSIFFKEHGYETSGNWLARAGSSNAHKNVLLTLNSFFLGSRFVQGACLSKRDRTLARKYISKESATRLSIPRANAVDLPAKRNHALSGHLLKKDSSIAHDGFFLPRDITRKYSKQPLQLPRRASLTLGVLACSFAEQAIAADSTKRCVFVAGARGRTGGRVLESLRAAGIEAIAGVRMPGECSDDPLPGANSQLAGIRAIQCDLTLEDASSNLAKLLRDNGVTDVICTLGFAPTFVPETDRKLAEAVDFKATRALIAASEAAELKGRFVLVSSLGVNATSASAQMLDRSLGNVLMQKRAAEIALRASNLDWVVVRPGLLDIKKAQGGILLGEADRWIGDVTDVVEDLSKNGPIKCNSPFLMSSGAVCAATRSQVAEVCVAALNSKKFSRRVVEVVTHPEVGEGSMKWVS